MATLPAILLTLAAISMGATVISIIIVIRSTREARSTIFPIVREEETIRARRARWFTIAAVSLTAIFLGGWLATTFRFNISNQTVQVTETVETKQPEPSFTPEPTSTQIVIIVDQTATAAPATATSSPIPTDTAVPTPTQTPPPETEPAETTETALPSGATVGPIQFATAVNDNVEPINPQESFSTDIENIYAVFPYSGMENGLDVKAIWYQNGVELLRNESEWEWGSQGRFYTWIRPAGQGEYKLEVYVNDSVMASGLFEIR